MMKRVASKLITEKKLFEDVKHTDEDGEEYWLARELQEVLQYKSGEIL